MGSDTLLTRPLSRRALAGLTVAASAGLLAACTPGGAPQPSGGASASAEPGRKTLTIGAVLEPETLDPRKSSYVAAAQAQLFNVYETLVKVDGEGKLQPLLAQRWEVSPDRLTYTFHLNPAATFSSGAKVTAAAVAANIERVRTAPAAELSAKYSNWMKVVASATPVDDATLKVVLTRPSNTWLYAMGDTTGIVAEPTAFATLGTASAGSGPYVFADWKKGDSIVLKRNPKYWGTAPRFDTVTFKYFTDPNAMNAALMAGTLDVISNEQAPDALAGFSADAARYQVIEGTTNGEVTVALNNASPALKDVRVRRAIAMALDKKKIVADVQAGHGTVIGSMAVPTDPYYEDLSATNAYNPDEAKKLLAAAGATNLTLRLRPLATPYATAAATDIVAMLQAVGIKANLTVEQPGPWYSEVFTKGDYDLSIVMHAEARDLNTYTNPQYYWRYTNPAFDAAWLAADTAPIEQYPELMKKATKILADDAASVWLYTMPNLVVARTGLSGLPQSLTTDSFDITAVASK